MRINLLCASAFLLVPVAVTPTLCAQVFDNPTAAATDEDFPVQGEYVGTNQAMQVIARGDGNFEMVVYALGLPGAGWDKSPPRRVEGDADTVDQLVESMGLKRVERKSPTLGAKPPADAIVLFDGSEESLRANWNDGAKRTEDGLLMQGATSKQTFGDYRLHLEFITPYMPNASGQGRGNSGVYHQGRYETQVLDSFGLAGKNNETGGIYEIRDPDLNMCLPPLTWQTYDVEFTAARFDAQGKKTAPARLTVNLNGVPVQVGVEVPGPTRAAPKNETPEPGPIYIQDHGNPVRFRNIWIVPRDAAKESRRPIVSGFERFFVDSDPKKLGGRLLVETLGCQSCHVSGNASDAAAVGPNLDQVASRVRADHLVDFIASPRDTKVGTTMPDPWHGLPDDKREQSAIAIANFLVAGTSGMLDPIGDPAAADRGKVLYHNQGCVACHAPQEPAVNAAQPQASIPLGNLPQKYTLASLTSFLLDPVAVRPCGRMPKLVADASEAKDIATYLLRDVVVVPGGDFIKRKIYRGKWDRLPDLATLKPDSESLVNQLKIDDIPGEFAASFDAFVQITQAGDYTFKLASDDGSRLIIDGKTIIDLDGIHPESENSKTVKLEAGVYPIRVLYFEGGGQRALKLDVESASSGRSSIVTMMSGTVDGIPRQLVPTRFKPDATLAAEGAKLFVNAGCINCHAKSGVDANAASKKSAKPLADCTPDAGCLASDVPAGLPNYELTSTQRQQIANAIGAADALTSKLAEVDSVHYTMTSLNCYACHVRDTVGGPDAARSAYFTTTTPEMGDEGRLPPTLAGTGDKLNEPYIREILAAGVDERPYMRTRMPGFGAAIPEEFVATLVKLDSRDEGHDGKSIAAAHDALLADGRTLSGNSGLACIKCHTFGGVGLPGIQAIDMLRMPTRLRRDWFERYLLDPQAYRPGTRMPASFPDGKSVLTRIADGRPADQIEAMWRYLQLGKDAKAPSGLIPGAIELRDPDRPYIYRNFFSSTSPRGIAVGYPEEINLIWDAERMSLSSAWKNSFIDAARHWTGRGQGNQDPLGDAIIKIDQRTPVAILADASVAWPEKASDANSYRFLGYRLDKTGRPTFRYRTGSVTVEDKPVPVVDGSARMMERSLVLNGEGNPFVLLAKGKIESSDDGWYRVDDKYRIRVTSGEAKLLSFNNDQELRAAVTLVPNQSQTITVQVSW